MFEIITIDPENPARATCRLLAQTGGRGFFAEVTISIDRIEGDGTTEFSGNEFSWLKDEYGPNAWEWSVCGEFRNGAISGVQWAREHSNSQVGFPKADITIERIGARPTDTNRESCAYVACLATWAALGIEGSARPFIQEGSIIFSTQ